MWKKHAGYNSVSVARRGNVLRYNACAALAGAAILLLGATAARAAREDKAAARDVHAQQAVRQRPQPVPTLTSAKAVHNLTPSQAEQRLPVHLRAVCVVCFSGWHGLFVNDGTTGVYVETKNQSLLTDAIHAGTLLDIVGVTGPGEFAPVVDQSTLRIVGEGRIPPPRMVSLDHLETGVEDGQWIAFDGTVRSAAIRDTMLVLAVASGPLKIEVMTRPPVGRGFKQLINARVRISGTAGPIFNQRGQLVGVNVYVASFDGIQVLQPAPIDPFALPLRQIKNVFEYAPGAGPDRLVRFRGVVYARWGQIVFINDGVQGASVLGSENTSLKPGDVVDAVGYPVLGGSTHAIEDAIFKPLGTARLPEATPVSAKQALSGDFEGGLIRVDGRLMEQQKAPGQTTLLVDQAGAIFHAILPEEPNEKIPAGLHDGSQIQVTGICVISEFQASRHYRLPKAFQIVLRSPADIVVIKSPSWWTPAHALMALSLALVGIVLALAWVVVLGRRVAQQTHLLRKSEEQFRYMALHDNLTGLATRLLLSDRLDVALESAKRRGKALAVLMLDLDRFKEINDTFGHSVGDQVLRITADRIVGAVRKSDTVARVGGDEFVVLLTDLGDPDEARMIAAKLVADLSVPVALDGREVPVSVSVGVCNVTPQMGDADELLKDADIALYLAKANGRHCSAVFTPELQPDKNAPAACMAL